MSEKKVYKRRVRSQVCKHSAGSSVTSWQLKAPNGTVHSVSHSTPSATHTLKFPSGAGNRHCFETSPSAIPGFVALYPARQAHAKRGLEMPGAGGTQSSAVGMLHFPTSVLQALLHFGGDTAGHKYSSRMRKMSRGDREVIALGRIWLLRSVRMGPIPLLKAQLGKSMILLMSKSESGGLLPM